MTDVIGNILWEGLYECDMYWGCAINQISITIMASNDNENNALEIKRLMSHIPFVNDALVLFCVINPAHSFPIQWCDFAHP